MLIERIPNHEAAQAFRACAGLDPEGIDTPESAAWAGLCLRLRIDTGELVLSVGHRAGALWCFGAAGQGRGMTGAGLDCLERLARDSGLTRVGFQTVRRGLVKRATVRGYKITEKIGQGARLEKVLQ